MKPLARKKRTISIIILGILFLLAAPVILLYSFGYRLGAEFALQKTGGIFIHSNISNASVFLDGEYVKDSGIFLRNTLIQDLTPEKEHLVEIHKDGYQSWIKNIFVYPSIVSEGRVLLLPNEFEVRELFKFVDEDGFGTSTPKVKTQVKPTNAEYIVIETLFNIKSKRPQVATSTIIDVSSTTPSAQKSELQLFFESLAISDFEDLPNMIIEGKEVSWLSNGDIVLYWIDDNETIPYYYCGGVDRVCENKIMLDWEDPIQRFTYFPGRNDVWIVLVESGIYAVEVDGRNQRNIQKIYEGSNLDFRLTNGDQLIIKEGTKLFEINL